MNQARRALLLFFAGAVASPAMAAAPGCQPVAALTIRVQFADELPRDLLLQARAGGGLRLQNETGDEQWSGGSGAGVTQRFPEMNAAFSSSLTAMHLDEDGIHDRLYAGDLAGNLWRFDLRAGASPAAWMNGGQLANLGTPAGGRGFVAPPDVSFQQGPNQISWLNVALGTANTGPGSVEHRFYVLRDSLSAPMRTPPLTEADLLPAAALAVANLQVSTEIEGYYLPLGTAQVFARALTLAGNLHFTAVESHGPLLAACGADSLPTEETPISVTVVRAEDGAAATDSNNDGRIDRHDLRHALDRPLPATTAVELALPATPGASHIPCQIAGEPLLHCHLDTRPRRTWWRREDAG